MKILSARYANANGTAIEAQTDTDGAVIIVPERAELWELAQEWLAEGGAPAAFVPVEGQPPVAEQLEALKQLMMRNGVASEAEIAEAVKGRP
jgi:hypothetical protein